MSLIFGPRPILITLIISPVIPGLAFNLGFFGRKNVGIKEALNEKILNE
jgi:hypothetical protein